ncbi:MAG: hypothetical protein Kow0068_17470 [Marinilabiliales bacterium]
MISYGKNIKSVTEHLEKIDINNLFHLIKNPNEEIKNKINQLRSLQSIDYNKYRALKTTLPYVCCGIFQPPLRNTKNFAYTQYFILDADHLSNKDINIDQLIQKLKNDSEILLMFRSPGNNGLKIFFKLSDKCYDAGKYSLFYKKFAYNFSLKYKLEQVIDLKTCDVTRACFLSYDREAYINPLAEEIDIAKHIDFENEYETGKFEYFIDKKINNESTKKSETKEEKAIKEKKEITPDVLAEIKSKLTGKHIKTKPDKIIYTPEELNDMAEKIVKQLNSYGVNVESITNIHYGKKISMKAENHVAEINLFYGKKGFTAVKSPKRGTNPELCDLCYKIICEIIYR